MTSLPSFGCLSKIDTSAWPQIIVQGALGEAAWPVISRITKGKFFFPCPFGKLPLFKKRKVYMDPFFRLCQPWMGEDLKPLLGDSGMLCLPKCSSWANFPSPAALKSPGSQTSLHISRGENQHGCFTTWQILRCGDTSTHPLLPISISKFKEPFRSSFPQEKKPSSTMCKCSETHEISVFPQQKKKAALLSWLFLVEPWTKQEGTCGDGLCSAPDEQKTQAAHTWGCQPNPTASACGFAQEGTLFIS